MASQPMFRTAETDAALRPAVRTNSPRAQQKPVSRALFAPQYEMTVLSFVYTSAARTREKGETR